MKVQAPRLLVASVVQFEPGVMGGGGARIWKWRTRGYQRGIWCKISLKKRVIRCGLHKNVVFFDVDSQKWGSFSVQKWNIQAKIDKFYVEITAKFVNFLKCNANLQFVCKIWHESGETDLWVTLSDFYGKKRKIGKRNLYLTENRISRNKMWCAAEIITISCVT